MEDKVIVLVTDSDDDKHGEISVLDDRGKAVNLVETLLEAGFERERIHVLSGDEMSLRVSHRPAVSLKIGSTPVEETNLEESNPKTSEAEVQETSASGEGFRFSSLFPSS